MVQGDSTATLLSLVVLVGATVYGYLNSLFEPATLMMLSYGMVTLFGGVIHQLNGEWGIVNISIAVFGVMLVMLYWMIDMMTGTGLLSQSMETFLYLFWYGFSGIMTAGLAFFIAKFQISA